MSQITDVAARISRIPERFSSTVVFTPNPNSRRPDLPVHLIARTRKAFQRDHNIAQHHKIEFNMLPKEPFRLKELL